MLLVVQLLEIVHTSAGDELPLIDDAHPVAQLFGHLHDMGGKEERLALVAVLAHDLFEVMGGPRVQPHQWLIQHHYPGRRKQSRHQDDLLPHAVGIALDGAGDGLAELEDLQPLFDSGDPVLFGYPVDIADEIQILQSRQPFVDGGIVRHVCRHGLALESVFLAVQAVDDDRARVRLEKPDDHFDGRGFPRAVGAQKAEDLAGLDDQVELVDGLDLALIVTLGNAPKFDHGGTPLTHLTYSYNTYEGRGSKLPEGASIFF